MLKLKKAIKAFFLSKPSTTILFPALAALPPALVVAAKLDHPWPDWFFDWFKGKLHDNQMLGSSLAFWPLLLLPFSYAMTLIRDWAAEQGKVGEKHLSLLFQALDSPVGEKLSRFGKVAKRVLAQTPKPNASDVFREITLPEIQIGLLVKSLHIVFQDEAENKEDLKVVLARMEKGRVVGFEHYLPRGDGPRSTPEELNAKECGFIHAAKTKDIVIIPDISKELAKKKNRRFTQSPGHPAAEGSMICFPIVDTELDSVPFVISVKYSEKNHFTEARKRRYRYILRTFGERIALENRLQIIKEATIQ